VVTTFFVINSSTLMRPFSAGPSVPPSARMPIETAVKYHCPP